MLNLPLMVAEVLTRLWRDVAGVTELTRMLAREGFLWCRPTTVSQPAMSQKILSFPASLFEGVFKNLLPNLKTAWYKRNQRPLPESIQFALTKFSIIWIVESCDARRIILQAEKPPKIYREGSWQEKRQQS